MAASMIKGFSKSRILCALYNEIDLLHSLQKPQCRYVKTARKNKTRKTAQIKDGNKMEFKKAVPTTDIYMIDEFPPQKFTLAECVTMHKDAAQPAMGNCMQSCLYAEMKLDMSTVKQTKFMRNFHGLLQFPHSFEHGQTKKLIVFCGTPEDLELAKNLGAHITAGADAISQIKKGMFWKDDIEKADFVLVTADISMQLLDMKGFLKDKLPSIKNGCIINDVRKGMEIFYKGVKYESNKESEAIGRIQIPFCQMNQNFSEIETNFQFMIEHLTELKVMPTKKKLAPLIQSITLIAPPSQFQHEVKAELYVPGLNDEEPPKTKHLDDDDDEEKMKASAS